MRACNPTLTSLGKFLWTGGMEAYLTHLSFCCWFLTLSLLQRGEGGKGREPLEGPENHIKLITYSTECRIQNTEYTCSKLVYIKLPMYLFFMCRFDLMILMGAITRPLEGLGPKNLYFFGSKKVLIFRAHPFQWPSKWIFPLKSSKSLCPRNSPPPTALKGQCHEIFDFWFFSWISFPQAPEYTIRVVTNVFENSRRYSLLKVCHRCQRHRRQMQKIFNHKSFNYLVWTPLRSIVNL